MQKIFLFSIIGIIIISSILLISNSTSNHPQSKNIPTNTPTPSPSPPLQKKETQTYPTLEFNQRITKKPFGMYITPQNSPVKPERFSGYHTGVDVEFENTEEDVPVFSVCDGELVLSKWVNGYGGTAVIKCQNNYYLYGHLKLNSITNETQIPKDKQIAILGQGNTQETDFERKHLHFGVHKNSLNLKGYVSTQSELQSWIDPLLVLNIEK